MRSTTFTKVAMAAVNLLTAASLMAQVQTGQGVARISLIHGDVSTQRGDSGDTAAAALNAPVVTGDRISTGDNSRAEVQLDFANVLRLSERSTANVASLTDKEIQIQVSQGSATYTAFKTSEIRPEVDTANLSVRPAKGDVSFRIEAISADETEVTVRKGEAEVSTSSGSQQVRKGEMIVVRGSGTDAQFKVEDARNRDDWDKWNDDRDHLISNAEGVHRTSPYYTGSQDLDAYGHWRTVPEYGSVWVPTVSADWVPYREGRWVWEPYYGWTWVSSEAWGWAPYHYGRWFYSDSSWVWWPGPVGGYGYGGRYYRPVWAPAYVSFFGFGGGIGIGFGSFGWLPTGPCDEFRPWYGGYGSRFNQVNVTNITNVTNIYNYGGRGEHFRGERPLYQGRGVQYSNLRLAGTDVRIRRAISSVPAEHFGSGRVAARGIDPGTFREARMMTGNLPVVPTRASLNASNRLAAPDTFRGGQPSRFFGTNRPAPSPQSFDHQAAQVQQSIQRDGHFTPIRSGEPAGNGLAGNNPAANRAPGSPVTQNPMTQNRGGENAGSRNGTPERGSLTAPKVSVNQPNRSSDGRGSSNDRSNNDRSNNDQGWHRFPSPASGPAANRGTGSQPESRGTIHDLPTRTGGGGPRSDGGGWQRFPSSNDRGSGSVGNPGNTGRNEVPRGQGRGQEPSNTGNGGWNRGPRPEARSEATSQGSGNGGRYQGPSNGGGGWDRGNGAQPSREGGSPNRGSYPERSAPQRSTPERSAPSGDYSRSGGRPTLDMRQPVMTPRSSGPSYGGGGGGRMQSPRPPSGGGGRSEPPRPPSGGGRPSGGERRQ